MKKITQIILLCFLLLLFTPDTSLAFKFVPPAGVNTGNTTTLGGTSAEKLVETIITNVINIFFTIGGLGVIIYSAWGTLDWILSGGDKEKVTSARRKLTHATIGLILLSLSFVLINIIGQIVGFNPLGNLQLRDLGTP